MEPAQQPPGLSEDVLVGRQLVERNALDPFLDERSPVPCQHGRVRPVEQLAQPNELAHGLGALEVPRLDHTAIVEVDTERHAVELSRSGRT